MAHIQVVVLFYLTLPCSTRFLEVHVIFYGLVFGVNGSGDF